MVSMRKGVWSSPFVQLAFESAASLAILEAGAALGAERFSCTAAEWRERLQWSICPGAFGTLQVEHLCHQLSWQR